MKHSRSSILLMEMIICIFFFALCAVISSQVFVQAHLLSKKTISENHAVIVLESLSEGFYAANGDVEKVAGNYDNYAKTDTSSLIIYMDKDYNYIPVSEVTEDNYSYFAQLTIAPDIASGTIKGKATFYAIENTIDNTVNKNSVYSIDLVVNDPIRPVQ